MAALDQITLKGFKSIRELTGFKLEKLNVLVGANGAGKINLVDFFRMFRAMADGGLQSFVTNSGGADGFFFNGPKETKQISAHLKFGLNQYRFALEPTVSSEMMIREEATLYTGGEWRSDWHTYGSGMMESRLKSWKDRKSDKCLATALLQPKPPSTVVVDESELCLHPYALEVFAQLLKEAAERTQLVISTQSAPLLNQFEPQEVVVVERVEGASHFRRLEAEPLAEGLKDYALGELIQTNVIEAGPTHA